MASPLADVVNAIKSNSDCAPNLKKLLNTLQTQEELLIQHMPQLDEAAQALSPAQHTLGLVFILNCKGAAVPLSNPAAVQVFMGQCRRMLLGCDPEQVQMVPRCFVSVCTKFIQACQAAKSPLSAIRPLQHAACALQPSPSHFTPLHAEFLKVCLLAKCYSAAQPILDQELLHVDREATLVVPRDLLLYHYYAGMVQTGLKRYQSAVNYFTLAVSAPTHVINAIMLEAYKKALFCSLVDCGEPPRLPKYVSPTIARAIKNSLAPYTEFADAFAASNVAQMRALLTKHAAAFQADHNLGLAKQCVPALMRRTIRRLTETYLTLSLVQIAELVGLDSATAAERQVREMIISGDIHATIDQQKGVVHFLEKAENYDSHEAVKLMETALGGAISLAAKLQDLHSSLAVDQNYLARIATQDRQPQWGDEESLLSK